MHNFEERIQEPVKKFSQSLYGHMVVAGGVVVNRMTTRSVIIIILIHMKYQIYHTDNRLRSFLSSCQLGHPVNLVFRVNQVYWVIWVIKVIPVIPVI